MMHVLYKQDLQIPESLLTFNKYTFSAAHRAWRNWRDADEHMSSEQTWLKTSAVIHSRGSKRIVHVTKGIN